MTAPIKTRPRRGTAAAKPTSRAAKPQAAHLTFGERAADWAGCLDSSKVRKAPADPLRAHLRRMNWRPS